MPVGKVREILPQLRLVKKESQRLLVIEALTILGRYKVYSDADKQRILEIHEELGQLQEKGERHYD